MKFKSQDGNENSFSVNMNENGYKLEQDVQAYKDYASLERQKDEVSYAGRRYRSFAIIPDIVAIDILNKHGLDIHSPDFMSDPSQLRKLKRLIETEYPLLKTSNVKAL
jgi:hypothetical protein